MLFNSLPYFYYFPTDKYKLSQSIEFKRENEFAILSQKTHIFDNIVISDNKKQVRKTIKMIKNIIGKEYHKYKTMERKYLYLRDKAQFEEIENEYCAVLCDYLIMEFRGIHIFLRMLMDHIETLPAYEYDVIVIKGIDFAYIDHLVFESTK